MKWKNIRLACCLVLLSISPAHALTNPPPDKGLETKPLDIASWNMQWLTHHPVESILESQRSPADLAALRSTFQSLDASVLAFQEVNDTQILRSLIGDGYQIVLSDRAHRSNQAHQFVEINQYTGVAIDKRIPFVDPKDVRLDGRNNSKLRFATYVVLFPDSEQPIHLLSLHLKAGCRGKYKHSRSACRQLKQQTELLNQWMRAREAKQEHYLLVGDFNHNLSYPNDWQWTQLRANTHATLATRNTPAKCKVRSRKGKGVYQYPNLIDHVIVSDDLIAREVYQAVYPTEQVLNLNLSDHCPVVATLAP